MSFLFKRSLSKSRDKEKHHGENGEHDEDDSSGPNEIGSFQPENPFRDIVLLPKFENIIQHVVVLDDSRIICGDCAGNLTVWDIDNGLLIKHLVCFQICINGILIRKEVVYVISNDHMLTAWHAPTLNFIRKIECGANCSKSIIAIDHSILAIGIDMKLVDYNLDCVKYAYNGRKNRSDKLNLFIAMRYAQARQFFVFASNFDIEIYEYNENEDGCEIRQHQRHSNAHMETILCLHKIDDKRFASGSADGHLIIWSTLSSNNHYFDKLIDVQPFEKLINKQILSHSNLISIECIRNFDHIENCLILASGKHLCLFNYSNLECACKIHNAHDCKITDLILLNTHVITSSDDGSMRIWKLSNKHAGSNKRFCKQVSLRLIGELLGHSAAINFLTTATKTELISTDSNNMIIIWRNSKILDYKRDLFISRFLTKVKI